MLIFFNLEICWKDVFIFGLTVAVLVIKLTLTRVV